MDSYYTSNLAFLSVCLLAAYYYCRTQSSDDNGTAPTHGLPRATLLEQEDKRGLYTDDDDNDVDYYDGPELSETEAFEDLQLRFLSVYILVVAADWLQVRPTHCEAPLLLAIASLTRSTSERLTLEFRNSGLIHIHAVPVYV